MMTTRKRLEAIDSIVIDYYATRNADDKSWSLYCSALKIAEAAHGCKLIVIDNTLYELKPIFSTCEEPDFDGGLW